MHAHAQLYKGIRNMEQTYGNVVYHGVELLLLVSMLLLLAIPKSILNLKKFLCTSFYMDYD